MELAIEIQRRMGWSHWLVPTVVALGVTYVGLWLLTFGLVHRPTLQWLPLDVVLEAPQPPPSMTPAPARPSVVVPPKSAVKSAPLAPQRKWLTQEPVAAAPAPPLQAPASPQLDVVTLLQPEPESNLSVTPAPPRLETVPVSRLTRTPAYTQKALPEDPKGVSLTRDGVRVVARITLDETAAVRDVEIIKSGGAAFDAAVITAIRRSRFTPGYIDDRPVAVAFNQSYRFQLQ